MKRCTMSCAFLWAVELIGGERDSDPLRVSGVVEEAQSVVPLLGVALLACFHLQGGIDMDRRPLWREREQSVSVSIFFVGLSDLFVV